MSGFKLYSPAKNAYAQDASALLLASLAQNFGAFLFQVLAARTLPIGQYGEISFFLSLVVLYTTLGTAGPAAWLVSAAARRTREKLPPPYGIALLALLFFCTIPVVHSLLALCKVFTASATYPASAMGLVIPLSAAGALYAFASSLLIGSGRRLTNAFGAVATEFLKIAGFAILILLHKTSSTAIIFTLIVGTLAGGIFFLWSLFTSNPPVPQTIRSDWHSWKNDLAGTLSCMATMVTSPLLPRALIVLAGWFYSSAVTAQLAVAITFLSIFGMVLTPVQTALFAHSQTIHGPRAVSLFYAQHLPTVLITSLMAAIIAAGAGWFLTGPLFGRPLIDSRELVICGALAFMFEWPRVLFDALLVGRLPTIYIALIEALKWAAILSLVIGLHQQPFTIVLGTLGAVFASVNLLKGVIVLRIAQTECPA